MADAYLDSTGAGTAASPYDVYGTNEAKALSAFDAETFMSLGDTVWVSANHVETTFATYTAGTNSPGYSPRKFITVSDIGTNTTLVTQPSAGWTSINAQPSFEGEFYFYGWKIRTVWGGSPTFTLAGTTSGPHKQTYEVCLLEGANGNGGYFQIGASGNSGNDSSTVLIKNSSLNFNNTNQYCRIGHGDVTFENITLAFGTGTNVSGTYNNTLFATNANNGVFSRILLQNSDLTGVNFIKLFAPGAGSMFTFTGRNLKLPSSCTTYCDSISDPGNVFTLDDSTVGSTYLPFYRRYYSGQVTYETTIIPNSTSDRMYLTNDQSDGGYAIKMVSDATTCGFLEPLYSDWIHIQVENTSTAITPFAEILLSGDGATSLTDRETWVEVDAMAGTTRLGARSTDAPSVIANATNQATGTLTWTGHGYSSPTTHKLALGSAITPGVKGYIRLRVVLAKAGTTLYVGRVGYS
jgi:hypothetical protein